MTHSRSQPMIADAPGSIDVTWHRGAYYVSVPNWNGGTVYTADHVAALKARITKLEGGLTWIVNSPSAHPANMVKVAEDALKPIKETPHA